MRQGASGSIDFYIQAATVGASVEKVLSTPELKTLSHWSPDGRFLLYDGQRADRLDGDIFALPLEGDKTPMPLTKTRFEEGNARFSPDGKWIAYQSNETGRFEIWAQPFPSSGERVQISTTGGAQAQWGPQGKELFYIGIDEGLMAVPLRVSSDNKTLEPGPARALFLTRIPGGAVLGGGLRQQYVVSPDGQRFLMRTVVDDAPTPITLILNWTAALKK